MRRRRNVPDTAQAGAGGDTNTGGGMPPGKKPAEGAQADHSL
ncbi:hypothetical protein [Paenibacillus sp. OV219]|nr:hypothetical protein [Paenibacillus sp. OV219]